MRGCQDTRAGHRRPVARGVPGLQRVGVLPVVGAPGVAIAGAGLLDDLGAVPQEPVQVHVVLGAGGPGQGDVSVAHVRRREGGGRSGGHRVQRDPVRVLVPSPFDVAEQHAAAHGADGHHVRLPVHQPVERRRPWGGVSGLRLQHPVEVDVVPDRRRLVRCRPADVEPAVAGRDGHAARRAGVVGAGRDQTGGGQWGRADRDRHQAEDQQQRRPPEQPPARAARPLVVHRCPCLCSRHVVLSTCLDHPGTGVRPVLGRRGPDLDLGGAPTCTSHPVGGLTR